MAKRTKTQNEALGDIIEALMKARASYQCALDRRDLAGANDYMEDAASWAQEEGRLAAIMEREHGVALPWLREWNKERGY
jgi:hypothetical protein